MKYELLTQETQPRGKPWWESSHEGDSPISMGEGNYRVERRRKKREKWTRGEVVHI